MPSSHCSQTAACINALPEGNNHIRLIIDTKKALRGADNDNDNYLVVAKVSRRLKQVSKPFSKN
jgi:hypothetical protein